MSDIVIQFREKLARAEVTRTDDFSGNLRFDEETGQVVGKFFRCLLNSVYQPILDLKSGITIGHEAFIRSHHVNQGGLTPWNLFSQQADDTDLVYLDRLCRTLHTLNYFADDHPGRKLYLNVHGRLLLAVTQNHGQAFRRVLDSLLIPASNIILELPLTNQDEFSLVHQVSKSYRSYGFKIAVNVHSSSDANTLIHLTQPDVLKLNVNHVKLESEWQKVLKLARDHNVGTIATRVETLEQLNIVKTLGLDAAQGFYLGLPNLRSEIPAVNDSNTLEK